MNNSTVQEIRQWLTSNHIEMYDVVDFVIHPNYTNYLGISAKDKENDIAIILLDRQIKVSPYHNNICLPTKDYIEHSNTYALVTGYGYAGDQKLVNQLPAQITYNRIQEYNKTTEIRSEPVGQSGMACAVLHQ